MREYKSGSIAKANLRTIGLLCGGCTGQTFDGFEFHIAVFPQALYEQKKTRHQKGEDATLCRVILTIAHGVGTPIPNI
jgi:hypothetical protein